MPWGEHKDSPSGYPEGLFLCICSKFAPDNPSCKEEYLIDDIRRVQFYGDHPRLDVGSRFLRVHNVNVLCEKVVTRIKNMYR